MKRALFRTSALLLGSGVWLMGYSQGAEDTTVGWVGCAAFGLALLCLAWGDRG